MSRSDSYFQRLKWCVPFILGALAAGCGGGSGDRDPILGSGDIAVAAPRVTAVAPTINTNGVPVNTKLITAAFSKPMAPVTLTPASFTLACAGLPTLTGTTVTYAAAGQVATLKLPTASDLPSNTQCTATVTTAVKDTTGIALANPFVWTFVTGGSIDSTPPTVTSTSPLPNAFGVAINSLVTASFSEAMDPLTINAGNFEVTCFGAAPITGTVGYAVGGNTATFTPAVPLPSSRICEGTIGTGVMDLAGNALATAFVWSFTTGATLDRTAPTVSSTDPANAATGVPLNKKISAVFSEAMDPLTVNTTSMSVAQGATPVAGVVSYVGTTATFTPTVALAANTVYTTTLSTAAKDLAGNALASNFVWVFTTGATPDSIAPTVTSTDPANAATGVALNKKISAIFSEAMDPLTVNTTSMSVKQGVTPVAGIVSYVGTTATFTPTVALAANTTYTTTLSTAAKDLAGNALASNFVWVFTTGAAADITPPTLISSVPANAATGVPVNQEIIATFSEAMDPLTITNATFTLNQGATPITGSVTYTGTTATFAPTSPLANDTTYTVTISPLAKDLAGNALTAGLVPNPWTFRTATTQIPVPVGPAMVNLDCAANFAILSGSTVTNTGPTIITNGDIGLSPGTAVTGFPPGTIVGGAIRVNDVLANNAKLCLTTAYNDAAGRTLAPISVSGNIGGQTLAPGLYKSTSTLAISSGDLTLAGPADGVWIFQVASTLTTTAGRQVILTGGAQAKNVFWQVGTSATLGTTSDFKGNILADQSITLNTGAVLNGRALTRIGAIALDSNNVTKP